MTAMVNLRRKLAMAVKSIQWSYAIFWSISSTEPGVLTWCDGYYNGDIKTRKTIQAEEMKDDDDDDDDDDEDNDDDDDEVGFQRTEQLRQLYESLSAAAETNQYEPQPRKPSAALSPEDLSDAEWYFLVCMTYEFSDGQGLPARTLAENTTSWLSNAHFADSKVFSRSLLAKSASIQTVVCFPYLEGIVEFGITEKVLEEENIIKQIKRFIFGDPPQKVLEIPLESCSRMLDRDLTDNNLDGFLEYDQNLVTKSRNSPKTNLNNSLMIEDVNIEEFQSQEPRWQLVDKEEEEEEEVSIYHNNSMGSSDCISQNLVSGPYDLWSDDDSRYQCVLLKILKDSQRLILGPHFRNCDFKESAFVSWKSYDELEWKKSCSQMLLKKVLYEVPKMHGNQLVWGCDENGIRDRLQKLEADDAKNINHRFSILSSLVPSKGKVDKVSLLDDTIDYLKTLERRVEALESNKDKENKKCQDVQERTSDNYAVKRKASCDLEDLQEECLSDCITVSAIEKDVTIEIRCRWRDNMMIEVFDAMSSLNLESHSVHSSTADGILTLTIESKLKSCTASTAKMIRQALQRVIGRH